MAKVKPPNPDDLVSDISAAMPLRAAGFLVTLYGDAVVPRGAEVWMGAIIETCAQVGFSETLVRTAVSRLVAAGQLEGARRGRRSFYRLTASAQAEYAEAAGLIYGAPDPCGWRFVYLPAEGADAVMSGLERQGYARLRAQLAVGPARGPVPQGLLAFEAEPTGDTALLPQFVAQMFNLTPHVRAYADLIQQFAPVLPLAPRIGGPQALALRLLLVHGWRSALQHDPRLPEEALPKDWPGHAARTLFARLYLALSPAADSHIAAHFGAETAGLTDSEPRDHPYLTQLREMAAQAGGA
ncbi:PaaX family transcriptional regulator C-terminal domain-containing protein [Pararhodobacter oceanensis]|nr:PaaX family transcriptional regulator C-terminal domain-containing protein [Pararhodobacter oceanensis]